jgi:hypothetical protein
MRLLNARVTLSKTRHNRRNPDGFSEPIVPQLYFTTGADAAKFWFRLPGRFRATENLSMESAA